MGTNTEVSKLYSLRSIALSRVWQKIQDDDCFDLAAQTSFYLVLSLFPFCLVLAMIVGWLPSSALWKSFATWIVTYLPRDSQRLIFSTILGLVSYSAGFLSLGLIVTLWSASAGFVSLMESLTAVFGERDSRSYWLKHAIAACVTMLAALFALGTFGLIAIGHWGAERLSPGLGGGGTSRWLWEIGRWAFTITLLCFGIDLVMFVLPATKRPWRWLSPGTAFATTAFIGCSFALNLYFQHFTSYPRLYGALGGFIILMLWIYVVVLILLLGAEADSEIERSAEAGAK